MILDISKVVLQGSLLPIGNHIVHDTTEVIVAVALVKRIITKENEKEFIHQCISPANPTTFTDIEFVVREHFEAKKYGPYDVVLLLGEQEHTNEHCVWSIKKMNAFNEFIPTYSTKNHISKALLCISRMAVPNRQNGSINRILNKTQ